MNIFEQYELKESGRQEAKASALQALQEHLDRMNDVGNFTNYNHQRHVGYRDAMQFAITLVKLSI